MQTENQYRFSDNLTLRVYPTDDQRFVTVEKQHLILGYLLKDAPFIQWINNSAAGGLILANDYERIMGGLGADGLLSTFAWNIDPANFRNPTRHEIQGGAYTEKITTRFGWSWITEGYTGGGVYGDYVFEGNVNRIETVVSGSNPKERYPYSGPLNITWRQISSDGTLNWYFEQNLTIVDGLSTTTIHFPSQAYYKDKVTGELQQPAINISGVSEMTASISEETKSQYFPPTNNISGLVCLVWG